MNMYEGYTLRNGMVFSPAGNQLTVNKGKVTITNYGKRIKVAIEEVTAELIKLGQADTIVKPQDKNPVEPENLDKTLICYRLAGDIRVDYYKFKTYDEAKNAHGFVPASVKRAIQHKTPYKQLYFEWV